MKTNRSSSSKSSPRKEAANRNGQGATQTKRKVTVAQTNGHHGQEWTLEQLRKVKTGLSKKDLEYFRKLLLDKRVELIGDVESLQIDAQNDDGGISYEHMADTGTDSYEQEFTLGLVESERKLLGEIDEALQRVADGTYGVCVESGQPIGRPRLEAKPWAKYTIEVAREREKRGLAS